MTVFYNLFVIVCLNLFLSSFSCLGFEVPDAKLEVLSPRGFKVSIPDVDGIKLFAFHGKVNEPMNGREGGYFSRDIVAVQNGRWTFYEPNYILKVGDVLYYWTYVDYYNGINKLGYPKDNQKFEITEEHFVEGPPTSSPKPPTTGTTKSPDNVCENSITTINGEKSCKGRQIFSENFKKIDTNKWQVEQKFAGAPDYEFVVYDNKPEIVNTNKGHLSITPELSENVYRKGFVQSDFDFGERCTAKRGTTECTQKAEAFLILPPVASAQLTTKDRFSFKYGKIEINAKLPKGNWLYPELYLNPAHEEYGPNYESGQIRIAFCPGNDELSTRLYGGAILGTFEAARNYAMKNFRRNMGWTEGFHKFGVTWTKDRITLTVNDTTYGHIYAPDGGFASQKQNLKVPSEVADRWTSGSNFAPFDKEMYLTIGVGVGGHNFPDTSDGSKPWVNSDPKSQKKFYKRQAEYTLSWSDERALEVDSIKIFAL